MLIAVAVSVALAAYLLGSIPTSLPLVHWLQGVDVRRHGSGHAGATNTIRLAGWPAGVLVAILDASKGLIAVQFARWVAPEWALPIAAAAVVAGHCWPVFAGFRGGMGIATSIGALIAVWPPAFAIALVVDIALILGLGHTARANLFTGFGLWALVWLAGGDWLAVVTAAVVGMPVALRAAGDWNRSYGQAWPDRSLVDRDESEN